MSAKQKIICWMITLFVFSGLWIWTVKKWEYYEALKTPGWFMSGDLLNGLERWTIYKPDNSKPTQTKSGMAALFENETMTPTPGLPK